MISVILPSVQHSDVIACRHVPSSAHLHDRTIPVHSSSTATVLVGDRDGRIDKQREGGKKGWTNGGGGREGRRDGEREGGGGGEGRRDDKPKEVGR